jgi:hypothetical protein
MRQNRVTLKPRMISASRRRRGGRRCGHWQDRGEGHGRYRQDHRQDGGTRHRPGPRLRRDPLPPLPCVLILRSRPLVKNPSGSRKPRSFLDN